MPRSNLCPLVPLLLNLSCATPAATATEPSAPAATSAPAPEDPPSAAAPPILAPTPRAAQAISKARTYLGTPYAWAGRNTTTHPGLDCLGILYLAWGSVTRTPWTKYPVNPTKIVASHLLGDPVPGLDGVLRGALDPRLLQPGDVLYFLMADYEIPDDPLWVHDGVRYWPWHTGLYVGEAGTLALHASPSQGVVEQPLGEIPFDALYVTRP